MKRLFTIAILLIGALQLSAQISFEKDSTYAEDASSSFSITAKVNITNNSTDTLFRFIRVKTNGCAFESGVCDQHLCYPETTDTAEVIMQRDETFEMKVNYYPNNVEGCCGQWIYMESLQTPGNIDSCFFEACTLLDVEDVKLRPSFSIYPNPASTYVQLETSNNGPYDLNIYDLLGNKVLEYTQIIDGIKLDVASLPAGVYMLQINGDYTAVKTFKKR